MGRIDSVVCKYCKHEVNVFFYFSNPRITTHDSHDGLGKQYYTAITNARAVCPDCGGVIEEVFQKTLGPNDIISLAAGRKYIASNDLS